MNPLVVRSVHAFDSLGAHKTPADELVLDVLTPTPKDSATGASVVIAVDAGLAVVACGVTVTAKKE